MIMQASSQDGQAKDLATVAIRERSENRAVVWIRVYQLHSDRSAPGPVQSQHASAQNHNYFCDPYWELSALVLKSTNRVCSVLGGEPLSCVISLLGCSVSDSISTGSWNFLLLQHSILQCLPQQLIIFFLTTLVSRQNRTPLTKP